jgi:DNA-binding NarL/FixJ family response regulator
MGQVLLVDDSPVCRLGLRELLRGIQPELTVAEADTFSVARTLLRQSPDTVLVIIDIKMHDCGGFVGLFQLRSEFPHIPVVVYSATVDAESVSRSVTFGAAGYISKSAPCSGIANTLRTILLDKSWPTVPIIADANQINPISALSPSQLRVLRGLKQGLRNKQIAFELGLSEKTVKAYMSTLYRKLGVSSRTQALLLVQGVPLESLTSDGGAQQILGAA